MTQFITRIRDALARRRAYHQAIAEIEQLDARELRDMGVDRETLAASAHRQVYGHAQ